MELMENQLKSFSISTNLSVFVYDLQEERLAKIKASGKPEITETILQYIIASSKERENDIYFSKQQEYLGYVKLAEQLFICLSSNNEQSFSSYLKRDDLSALNAAQFREQYRLFCFLITTKWLDVPERHILSDLDFAARTYSLNSHYDEPHLFYTGFLTEQEMLLAVERGNVKEFNRIYPYFMSLGNFGVLASDDLRSKKNLTIAATTLFTRAAVKGGMFAENAYALSDDCIQKSEKREQIENVYEYTRKIGELFAERVARIKRQNLPTLIYRTQEYIYDHLATLKNIEEIAGNLNCSKSYLMHIFKQTTGQTIMTFINQQKLEEGKRQLLFTDLSIQDISISLGFKYQSQFSRFFKAQMGMTPSEYRDNRRF
ncbi:helix-turn-helix domain-containing protein [Listeria ilorinensis]|uniref:helix-turn-helix domain-containing protein n=1 Tax=Listeria ilorinensis TaxID=2867439 RepID=UPI001EF462BE|nr:AraC family transcriptional regulator [Listeria ilorinensis]